MPWNEEMQQFMAIDFEQGTLMPKKHPNKPYLYPKRMRNSSDPENAKRPGGLLAAQIKYTEGNCDSVHQRLSGSLKPTDSFLAIQVCVTHLALRQDRPFRSLREDYDIAIANFWKRHLTSREEYTLHSSYKLTDPPLGWHVNFGRLTFGSKWIGYYSCIHPFRGVDDLIDRQTCADFSTHWNKLPHLLLDVVVGPVAWPELFEREEFPYSAADDIHREWYSGEQFGDGDTYKVLGFSECLPGKQGGFPGWKRVCFMIYEYTDQGYETCLGAGALGNWEPGNWVENFAWAYGYEGAVLQGGRIMMGRWRKMMSQEWDGGPFIFWEPL
ncbi:uncharacterized protein CIMG_13779 [Coccidioides immitis RS]|uniref:Uncharacterized protein n=1 Tax=Coccidioides immitis (strain RS) TaxID=246410 RepID=J3KD16_COCIM|nr:uncharacterized protein CIMG_13779 [Coccidioides immitis RS]EAS33190.3 hypothetical protein CIMG_13779 [Coccidioides immitis RS]